MLERPCFEYQDAIPRSLPGQVTDAYPLPRPPGEAHWKRGVGQAERTSVGWGGNALAPVARW